MNTVFIVPTGIGCEIGGHAGDANPAFKLIASMSDIAITHPNVVNASDINEMPENSLYVEGSILDRFLRGELYLEEVWYNKILLVVNKPVDNETINAVQAARMTIGAKIEILELETELKMTGFYYNGKADGRVEGWEDLCAQVSKLDFDSLAIQTGIDVERETSIEYLKNGGINPWGGVEAKASKLIANAIDKPVAHAPFGDHLKDFKEVVDPRMSAEMVSICYLHCILKGLHKAPLINYDRGLSVNDVDFLITPVDCFGEPHEACLQADISIIAVRENKNVLKDEMPDEFIVVDNYIEVAGLLACYKSGVNWETVRRL